MSSSLPDVGVVGLGAMGGRIARRLLAAGYPVHGWNRTPSRVESLAAAGLVPWSTPREVAAHAGIVLSMVWDSAALRDVTLPPDGLLAGLTSRHVYVDLSTVEPEVSAEISRAAAERGAAMLDCPVSGSLDAAESGTLALLVGGPASALERVRPVLEQLGRHIAHLGEDPGLGLALKLAINLQVAIQAVAWGEGLVIAERAGISRAAATDAMLASVVASPMLRYRAPFVLSPPAEVWASAEQLRKDVSYALAAAGPAARPGAGSAGDAGDIHPPMPAGRVALALLNAVCDAGEADEEAAALARFVADRRRGGGPTDGRPVGGAPAQGAGAASRAEARP